MDIIDWSALDARAQRDILARPALADNQQQRETVATIISAIRQRGDAALREYTSQLDKVDIDTLTVPAEAIAAAKDQIAPDVRAAIDRAYATIRAFHEPSARQGYAVDTAPGVHCRRIVRALKTVGLYAPGGTAVLPSTVLMTGVPAQLAGCTTKVLSTPPRADGRLSPTILYAASLCGIDTIVPAGGAQAIAAMAYGTESVPKVDKLFGPGNSWVTEAKQQVNDDPAGAAIDMPAGPSELLIVADDSADPAFTAADLLSQIEHGPDSQVILVTASATLADKVSAEVDRQVATLPREATASEALQKSRIIVVADDATAVAVSNAYAPEHLTLNVREAEAMLADIDHAGSVFLGQWTPVTLGDYISGTNHVLPTYGFARRVGGLSVSDYQKSFTVQTATPTGLADIGPQAVTLAREEGLEAHVRAVTMRLAQLENSNGT